MKTIIILITASFFLSNSLSYFAQTITLGNFQSLAVCSDTTVRKWGVINLQGVTIGQPISATHVRFSSTPVNSLSGITAVALGNQYSIALKNNGTVWAWGHAVGEMGNGTNSDVPIKVSSLTNVIAIAGAGFTALALRNDGTVWAWGKNFKGLLGNGAEEDSRIPVQVKSLTGVVAISGNPANGGPPVSSGAPGYFLALKNNGTVWAWGSAPPGLGNIRHTYLPVPLESLRGIISISAGSTHSLALKDDGTVWAWGSNSRGELGNGAESDSNIPIQVKSLTDIIAVAAGESRSLALKKDGTVWTWGDLSRGMPPDFARTSNVPIQVNSLRGILAIVAGNYQSFALENDGTIWVWGELATVDDLGGHGGLSIQVPVQASGLCTPLTRPINRTLDTRGNSSNATIATDFGYIDVIEAKAHGCRIRFISGDESYTGIVGFDRLSALTGQRIRSYEDALAFFEGKQIKVTLSGITTSNDAISTGSFDGISQLAVVTVKGPRQVIPRWDQRTTDTETIIDLSTDILFDFNKSTINPNAIPALIKLARLLRQSKGNAVQLNGFTDSIGRDEYNIGLSQRRADAVKQWLVSKGEIDRERLITKGYGKGLPVAPNTNSDGSDSPTGRQKNRRVEIRIPKL